MSTVKSKKLQVGTDASASNNFTIYQPAVPDGTLRIGVGNADSPTEVARFDATGMISGGATPDALSTASGSAPSYSARAWVNFNSDNSPITVEGSGNVSSITDVATGKFTVNFTTAMSDANYAALATASTISSTTYIRDIVSFSNTYTTTSVQFGLQHNQNNGWDDNGTVSVAIFR
jgi:hypothetical protein